MYAPLVEGRVATAVDPRLAKDAAKVVAKVQQLVALYAEGGVKKDKLIFRIPATWEGIKAAKELEAAGIATQASHVFSLVQAIAAAQAGVSVIQPAIGRLRDW